VLAIQDFPPIRTVTQHWLLSVQLTSQTGPAPLLTTQGYILERALGSLKEMSQNSKAAWTAEKTGASENAGLGAWVDGTEPLAEGGYIDWEYEPRDDIDVKFVN